MAVLFRKRGIALFVVIDVILPIFGVVVLGYAAARLGWFNPTAEGGLSRFVFDWAVPLTLFRTLATVDLPDSVPWGLFISFYAPAVTVYLAGILAARFLFARPPGGQVVTGMGCSFGNAVFLGLPLVLSAYGEAETLPFFLLLSVHGLSYFTTTTVLLELNANRDSAKTELPGRVVKALVRNPILIGIVSGLVVNLTGGELPGVVDRVCELMAAAVVPAALFSLGCALNRYGLAGRLAQSLFVVGVKIVAFPAMVWVLAAHVFAIDPVWAQVATLLAAQPTGVMTYVFAKKYGAAEALATTSIFLSTLLSAVTLTVILALFRTLGV